MELPRTNAREFSVSELAQAVRRAVEDEFDYVRVRGEVSGFRGVHSSGHAYFTLKDTDAAIDAVIWRTTWQRLRFKPEEGLEVIATGRLTTYPRSSKYQLVIDAIEPAGAGALMALLEERRKMLAAEGLFAAERKKQLPYLPRLIGVVTSPTGAVIRDILHRLADRFPTAVLVWPVRVQGETAAAEIAAAVAGFNAIVEGGRVRRPDLLIVARGGGLQRGNRRPRRRRKPHSGDLRRWPRDRHHPRRLRRRSPRPDPDGGGRGRGAGPRRAYRLRR